MLKSIDRPFLRACNAVAGGLLLATVAMFLWLAGRGFEYTDESFYLLSLVWWREITSSFTLFGVVLGGLFDVVRQDIMIFRVVGMLGLLGSSAFMTRAVIRFVTAEEAGQSRLGSLVTLVAIGSAMQYYAVFGGMRIPSYNLLAMCALMVATGFLLTLLLAQRAGQPYFVRAVVYGGALALCAAGKISTALLLAFFHFLYFVCLLRAPKFQPLLKAVLGVLLGFAIVAAGVLALQPQAWSIMSTGLSMSRTIDDRYGALSLVNLLRWDIQRQLAAYWFVTVGLLLVAGGMRWLSRAQAVRLHSIVFGLAVLGCAVVLSVQDWTHAWLLLAALCWLWSFVPAGSDWSNGWRISGAFALSAAQSVALLLLTLPIAFSFGTNGRVLEHSAAAAAPAILAICVLALEQLRKGRMTHGSAAVCLLVLVCPALIAQVRIATELTANYRQRVPLGLQTVEVRVGGLTPSRLLVDKDTGVSIEALQRAAADAGFKPGTPIQDFTGDGAGLVFILGGRPLATAWMGGGYPGSEAAASKLLAGIDKQALEKAWLVSSASNSRAIRDWQAVLAQRLGRSNSHQAAATVTMRAPYDWQPGGSATWEVVLWRPAPP